MQYLYNNYFLKYKYSFFIILLFIWLLVPQQIEAKAENMIRVGLMDNQQKVTISSDADFVIRDLILHKEYRFKAHKTPTLVWDKGQIKYGKYILENNLVVAVKGKAPVMVNGRKYRGNLIVQAHPRGLTIINRLPMEDYLKGVVPIEMPSSWPPEALKAQAVAARTYAQYTKDDQKYARKGFDVCSSTNCQVYKGMSGETATTNQAIEDTRGQFLIYQNQPIAAVFHAASGGSTENSESVWKVTVPYLRSVDDYQEVSPYSKWVQKYDLGSFNTKLRRSYPGLGDIKALDFQYLENDFKGRNPHRGNIIINGSISSIEISPTELRDIFGLPSSNFSLAVEQDKSPLTKSSKAVKSNNALMKNKPATKVVQHILEIDPQANPQFIFTGSGYGHRLGMSQWGAKSLADHGKNYQQILQHYYTNVKLARLY